MYNERCKEFRKNQFFSNIFTFLSVICQNFQDNLRILANFGKFSRKNSKIYGFRPYVFKKLQSFFGIFSIKIIVFYTINLFIRPKNCVQSIFYNEKYKKFRKNQFFSNIFTFLSVIRQNFEDNLRILANFGKISHKNSKIYGFRPYVFKKLQCFFIFFNKYYTFYTKNLFIRPKNCVQSILYNERCKEFRKNQFFSNIFTFLSVIRQNFEDNLRILANFGKFSSKNSKIYGFRPYVFKKLVFFLYFLIKIIVFYTKNLFIRPKNCVQIIFYNGKYKKFRKNQFFSNIFIFLSVIRQNFEDYLKILANFGKYSHKNSKIYGFCPYVFQKLQVFFLYFLIKIILFTLKIYSFGPKIAFKAFCTRKDAKSFVKINFLVTFLHF